MSTVIDIFSSPTAETLGWTLLHSLWQGLLIAVLLIITLRFISERAASVRYVVSCAALMAFVLSSLITFIYLSQTSSLNEVIPASSHASIITFDATQAIGQNNASVSESDFDMYLLNAKAFVKSNMAWFVFFWLIGSVIILTRLVAGLWFVNRIKKHTVLLTGYWNEKLRTFAENLRVNRIVLLGESAYTTIPIVLGHVKPLIILPLGMLSGLSASQVEAIFMHELAHVKRNDYLTHIFQLIIESVFFFNPCVWFVSRIIKREREFCCDDIVVKESGSAMTYAMALAKVEEARLSTATLALSAAGTKNQLLIRIRRMMEKSVKNYSVREKILPIALFILLITCTSWLTLEQYRYRLVKEHLKSEAATQEQQKPAVLNREIPVDGKSDIPLKNAPASNARFREGNNAQPASVIVKPDPAYELKTQLHSSNYKVRTAAIESLSKIKNDSAGIWIAQALSADSSNHVRHAAAYALENYKSDYVFQTLLKALDDPSEQVQQGAIESLTSIGNKAALDPIIKKLDSKNRIIRQVALMGITDLGDHKTIKPYLERALQDDDRVVRDFARYTLSRMEE